MNIPFSPPYIDQSVIDQVLDTLKNKWITTGPKVKDFEAMHKPIIAYCRSGNRSGMAVAMLKQVGIPDTINGGGLEDLLQQIK
ncbi:MAG: hypothetical protein EOP48_33525 [Sphingobacteriales bacterium]|nr:MAG: hypothetical protein EOP48_33525 [Sphingobacteriales bacterium]